jgi:hypothetical protein
MGYPPHLTLRTPDGPLRNSVGKENIVSHWTGFTKPLLQGMEGKGLLGSVPLGSGRK